MKFNSVIVKCLSERCGCDVTTAAGATVLANDIEKVTGERLVPNTLKRLVGVLQYDYNPRGATLEIIAKYLGFSSWQLFIESINNRISDFEEENPFIEVSGLPQGTEIRFSWEPDREIRLCHLGEGLCEVVEVANSKLAVGDVLQLSQLADGYPLVAKDVVRGDNNLGGYVAAKITGISNIKIG